MPKVLYNNSSLNRYKNSLEVIKIINQSIKRSKEHGNHILAEILFTPVLECFVKSSVFIDEKKPEIPSEEVETLFKIARDTHIFRNSDISRVIPLLKDIYNE